MKIVSNTSPLISLAILGELDLLPTLFETIYVPQGVFNEASVWGKPYAQELQHQVSAWVKPVQNQLAVQVLRKDVDLGEAEVITLALENNIQRVLIDDFKGRQMAKFHNLSPIGTIGVLLEAKKRDKLSKIKPHLDKLKRHRIRISQSLYQKALDLAGETD